MLATLGRDTARSEAEVEQCLGEGTQQRRVCPNVDHGVGVVGRAFGKRTALGALQVNELPTDEGPALVQPFVELHEAACPRAWRAARS